MPERGANKVDFLKFIFTDYSSSLVYVYDSNVVFAMINMRLHSQVNFMFYIFIF